MLHCLVTVDSPKNYMKQKLLSLFMFSKYLESNTVLLTFQACPLLESHSSDSVLILDIWTRLWEFNLLKLLVFSKMSRLGFDCSQVLIFPLLTVFLPGPLKWIGVERSCFWERSMAPAELIFVITSNDKGRWLKL